MATCKIQRAAPYNRSSLQSLLRTTSTLAFHQHTANNVLFDHLIKHSPPALLSFHPRKKQITSCSTSSAYTCFRELFLTNPHHCIQWVAQHQIFPSLQDDILNFTWRWVKAFCWHQKYSRLLLPSKKTSPAEPHTSGPEEPDLVIEGAHGTHFPMKWKKQLHHMTYFSPGIQEFINKNTLKGANRNKWV